MGTRFMAVAYAMPQQADALAATSSVYRPAHSAAATMKVPHRGDGVLPGACKRAAKHLDVPWVAGRDAMRRNR